ncbi:hypothetical protein KBA41_03900 [Candidatus Ozemobacteraceae bacterium]|nr:hypothetical protein [Candidatus Ozemobacteraceae bacterium]
MNGNERAGRTLILLTVLLLLAGVVPADAYRPVQSKYEKCQDTLEELFARVKQMSADHGGFPPPNFSYATDTGEISSSFFVEQSLKTNPEVLRIVRPSCRYAVAPWAIPAPGRASGTAYDLYCGKHGFLRRCYAGNDYHVVTADSIRTYFLSNCTKHGIPTEPWKAVIDGLDPDIYEIGGMKTIPKAFVGTLMRIGAVPILFIQALIALGGCVAFLRRSGAWRANIWAGITTGVSLWVGFPTLYLLLTHEPAAQAMTIQRLAPLRILYGMQEATSALLFFFFFAMIFVFKKQERRYGSVILLTFAVVPGVLFTNLFTTIAGLWAFRSLLSSAASTDR